MGLRDVKEWLNPMQKDEIIKLVGDLYKKNKQVQEYLDFMVKPNEAEIHNLYREKLIYAFTSTRKKKISLKEAKKAITDLKKFNPKPEYVADLMMLYVEIGIDLYISYGYGDSDYFYSIGNTLFEALKYMGKYNIEEIFYERLRKIYDLSMDVGYGFYDTVIDLYGNFLSDDFYDEDDHEESTVGKAIVFELPKK